MRKTIIFVEGWTEQVWVREYLIKWHEYQNLKLDCFTLFNKKIHPSDYSFGGENVDYYYQIINTGGDKRVNDLLIEETPRLRNLGFNRIIGLRDMLSQEYRQLVTAQMVDKNVIEKIINIHRQTIKKLLQNNTSDIHLCYAIMEIEAWVLGLSTYFELIDARLTHDFINKNLNLDLENTDPETTIFNPATTLSKIFNLVDKNYGKRQGEIDSIISHLNKTDYQAFLNTEKCMSFNVFHNAIHENS